MVSDSIGSKIYSGVGGQVDFMRAAALSEGGKPIIALPSRTGKGKSRIVYVYPLFARCFPSLRSFVLVVVTADTVPPCTVLSLCTR